MDCWLSFNLNFRCLHVSTIKSENPSENGEVTQEEKSKLKRYVLLTIAGALGVVISAYFLVESAVRMLKSVGIPQTVIGATIIAFGTSLPELTLDLKSFLEVTRPCFWRHHRKQFHKHYIDFRSDPFRSRTCRFSNQNEHGCIPEPYHLLDNHKLVFLVFPFKGENQLERRCSFPFHIRAILSYNSWIRLN